jgi:diacylglycerol kinase family enzyme
MFHAVCICNPYARRAVTRSGEVEPRLRRHGYEAEFKWTRRRLHAVELAQKAVADKVDLVIAAG